MPGRSCGATVAAVAGAALGAPATLPLGIPVAGAVIAGTNGAISGWRGMYEWQPPPRSCSSFALDSTWALATTAGRRRVHGLTLVTGDAGYAPALSMRANRHVHRRGFQLRRRASR